jgi:L-iditol 2-dehydrogenase
MKALVYKGPWEMALEEFPDPTPSDGEALLQMEAVGICGSDVHGFTGESGRRKPGMVMGHEIAGRVLEVNGISNGVQPGDLVAVYNNQACGQCPHCLAGQEQRCGKRHVIGVNAGTWGAMADYLACPTRLLFPMNEGIDPAYALFAEPVAVALHAIKLMEPRQEDIIAIVGSGTIGLGLVMTLKAKGFEHVFALDVLDEKLELAAAMGAHPIRADLVDAREEIRRVTDGGEADGVFEAVGTADTVRNAFDLLRTAGSLVIIGNLAQTFTLPLQGITDREITVRGSYGFNRQEFSGAVELINQDVIALDPLISGQCTLEETPEIMTRLAKGELQAVKMVIRYSSLSPVKHKQTT